MSELTDKMSAALDHLKSELAAGGLTADQVAAQIHTAVDPQIADLKASIAVIASSENDDATKVADLLAAFGQFTDAFAPAPQPEPPPAATEPSPEPAPETAPTDEQPQA